MRVRIVTDSSAVVPSQWAEGQPLDIVPLTLIWDGDEYRNGEITYAEFAERAERGDSVPKTSAPSPGEFQEAFERALGEAEAVVCLTPPQELSATYSNAVSAAKAVGPDRVHVIDSRSAAAGQGLVAIEAARAGADGIDASVDRARYVAGRVAVWATLERLDYLKRSGRVPAVASFATGALDIHPIFRFVEGSASGAGASRGARRAAERVFRAWREGVPEEPSRCHTVVFHSSRLEEAERMRDRVLEHASDPDVAVVEVTASMAAHIGPGMLGLAWWWEPQS